MDWEAKDMGKKYNSSIRQNTDYIGETELKFLEEMDFESKTVVDVGCGTGRLIGVIKQNKPKKIIGIDFSNEMLKIARKKNPKAKFIQQDLNRKTTLPKADIMLFFEVLENIHNPSELVKEASKKSDLTLFNLFNPIHPLGRIIVKKDKYSNPFSIREYFETIEESGMKIKRVKGIQLLPIPVKFFSIPVAGKLLMTLDSMWARLFPRQCKWVLIECSSNKK